jgi:ubiquinone biosynthesis protein COQ4
MKISSPTSRPADGLYLPEGAGVLTRLRVALRALKTLEQNPDDSVAATLLSICMDGDLMIQMVEELAKTEDGRELLRARSSLQGSDLDLASLRQLPEGTFGHAFARYFELNSLSPWESPYETRNDLHYVATRLRETHDLLHVVTGYATDPVGELELQAFMAGNLGLRTCLFVLLVSAIRPLPGYPPMWSYKHRLKQAYLRGRRSGSVVKPHYERYWASSMDEMRKQLSIAPTTAAN